MSLAFSSVDIPAGCLRPGRKDPEMRQVKALHVKVAFELNVQMQSLLGLHR